MAKFTIQIHGPNLKNKRRIKPSDVDAYAEGYVYYNAETIAYTKVTRQQTKRKPKEEVKRRCENLIKFLQKKISQKKGINFALAAANKKSQLFTIFTSKRDNHYATVKIGNMQIAIFLIVEVENPRLYMVKVQPVLANNRVVATLKGMKTLAECANRIEKFLKFLEKDKGEQDYPFWYREIELHSDNYEAEYKKLRQHLRSTGAKTVPQLQSDKARVLAYKEKEKWNRPHIKRVRGYGLQPFPDDEVILKMLNKRDGNG